MQFDWESGCSFTANRNRKLPPRSHGVQMSVRSLLSCFCWPEALCNLKVSVSLTLSFFSLHMQRLFSIIDKFLSTGVFSFNTEVSSFLHMVENTLRFIGPLITPDGTDRSSHHTGLILTDINWNAEFIFALSDLNFHWRDSIIHLHLCCRQLVSSL